MSILVAYASKHGATQEIAEHIATTLRSAGQDVEARPAKEIHDLTGYDAVVIGAAAYMGAWLPEATAFVRRQQEFLRTRPVWLFSSGPLGTAMTDAQGRDLLVTSEPKEFAEFKQTITPRDVHVFFGTLDPGTLGFSGRLIRSLPSGRALLPEGDFRDWPAIEAWAASIAQELALAPAPVTHG